MKEWEYSFLVFRDSNFIFYEANHEPRIIFQIKKSSIFGFSNKLEPDFNQTVVNAINKIAEEGWELSFINSAGLAWYFKRPSKG